MELRRLNRSAMSFASPMQSDAGDPSFQNEWELLTIWLSLEAFFTMVDRNARQTTWRLYGPRPSLEQNHLYSASWPLKSPFWLNYFSFCCSKQSTWLLRIGHESASYHQEPSYASGAHICLYQNLWDLWGVWSPFESSAEAWA